MNVNKIKIIERWQEEAALHRFRMIAPLVDETLDHAKRVKLRKKIANENDLSYKTIKRYDDAYRSHGFEGLKPRDRSPRNQEKLPENFSELLQEAIQLRREVPSRSVEQIITILELEGRVAPEKEVGGQDLQSLPINSHQLIQNRSLGFSSNSELFQVNIFLCDPVNECPHIIPNGNWHIFQMFLTLIKQLCQTENVVLVFTNILAVYRFSRRLPIRQVNPCLGFERDHVWRIQNCDIRNADPSLL